MGPHAETMRLRWRMRIALSLILVAGSFYIIISGHYPEGDRTWAAGLIGVIAGYWLR